MRVFVALVFLVSFFSFSMNAQNIQGVRVLKLSEYTLAKMGIRITDENVSFEELENITVKGKVEIKGRKVMLTKNSVKVKSSSKREVDDAPPFAPIFAVNVFKGGSAVFYSKAKDSKHNFDSSGMPLSALDSEWANQLVCIYIEFTPKSTGKQPAEKNQIYLWYKPSTEFLDYLPEDIAESVWAEMSTPKDRISATQTGRFTDSWRDANVLLSTKPLYPNPASGKANLDFSITAPSILTISLFDITGKKIKDFVQSEQFQSGSSSINLPLDGLTDGMYLVVITPNNASPVVQRLMIAQ